MKKGMVILLIISLVILTGLIRVNALTTITPSDYGHKVEYVEYITQLQRTETSNWIKGDFKDFCVGKCYLTKDWYYVKLNQSLNPGITYTWNFNTWITNRDNQNYYNKSNFYMIASNTGKYEGSSSANVTNLTCRAGIEEGSTSKVSWSCSFTPTTQINYLYLRITLSDDTNKLFTSYGCNKGSLLNDNAQIDAINNQTGVIKDQTDKINDTLTQDHNYNTNPSESTENEKQEMENYEQEEDNLRNGLDLSIEESEITINPNANNFIWETINKLRGMSGKIVLLFTSVLSLGLIKMILGR